MIRVLIGATALALLCACTIELSPRLKEFLKPTSKGQPALAKGLKQYEEGEYADSAKSLQGAIEQGLGDKEQVNAHKHLAFIHCASSRERQCRDEFRRALALDPTMELAPAEAGHPVWGPIFKSLKPGR
jgi:Tfp pilus assembly protein PilF